MVQLLGALVQKPNGLQVGILKLFQFICVVTLCVVCPDQPMAANYIATNQNGPDELGI